MTYFKRNRELDATLASNTTMNRSAFFKLLALGLFDILLTLPITSLGLVQDILQGGITGFWPGWKAVHASFSTIPTVTSEEWKSAGSWTVFIVRFDQWVNPIFLPSLRDHQTEARLVSEHLLESRAAFRT